MTGALRYEIRIRGTLGETILVVFPDFRAERRHAETVLVGAVTDRAALHAVLAEIDALGLELLEVRQSA